MLEFSLPTNDILLSKIFSYLDNAKATLNLQDYTISQTTLDQVFVNFASQESHDSLEGRKRLLEPQPSKQLPYLNDLKSRFSQMQINETRIDDLRNAALSNNDELMQKKASSNLLKSSALYSSHQFSQLPKLLPNQLPITHLRNSNSKCSKPAKKKTQTANSISPNKAYRSASHPINQLAQNSLNQLNGTTSGLYFNNQSNQTFKNYKNYNQLTYPSNYSNNLNAISNIYCSIGASNLYNTKPVQQPLIILPKTKRKK